MTTQFDAKIFNEEAFGKYMNAIPDVKRNKLLESGAITKDQRLLDLFGNQTNTAYGIIPFYGNLEGDPDNYDGKTDVQLQLQPHLNRVYLHLAACTDGRKRISLTRLPVVSISWQTFVPKS